MIKVVLSSFTLYTPNQKGKRRENSVIGGHKIRECTFPTVVYFFLSFGKVVYVTKESKIALCCCATNLYYL